MVFGHRLQRRTENRKTSSNSREIVEYRTMSIDKKELVRRVSNRVGKETGIVEEVVDATFNEIYQSLKQGEIVSLRDLEKHFPDHRICNSLMHNSQHEDIKANLPKRPFCAVKT